MLNGFKLIKVENIEDIKSKGYIYKHYSGLTLGYIENKDTNRVFSITFKTPSKDNTGVAHILEHCVLAGSKKYPLKDPFNELAKSKLYSYLNAITFKDKTMYPIGSYNEEELFCMADVYLDAVFNPLIFKRKEIFLQEGWHYTQIGKDKYTYNGIVYNEMRSIYTDTSYLIKRISYSSLFPDTQYKFDAAGDPLHIVDLSYNRFLDYYKETYKPHNAFIYLYGDLDINKYLKLINLEYLQQYNSIIKPTKISIQKSLREPKFVYKEDESQTSTHLCAAYVINTFDNLYVVQAMTILLSYLLEFDASPLRQELVKVGSSLSYEFDTDLAQPTFFIILNDAQIDIIHFRYIILKCIKSILLNSIDKELIDICINKHEFNSRKEDYGYKPRGLGYNLDMIASFMYHETSFSSLNKFKILNEIRDKKYIFEKMLSKYIIRNSHSSYTTLKGCNKSNILYNNKNLDYKKVNLDLQDMKSFQMQEEDKHIKDLISPIDINKISIYPKKYVAKIEEANGYKLIHSSIDLNKVISLSLCFNISCISKDLLPYIGLYTLLLGKLGTKNYTSNELSKKISYYFGYMSPTFNVYPNYKSKTCENLFELKTHFLEVNIEEVVKIIKEILLNTDFDNPNTIKKLIIEHKLKLENSYKNEGYKLAIDRVKLNLSNNYEKKEMILGLDFYYFLNDISKNFTSNLDIIIYNLKKLSKKLFIKDNFKALTVSNECLLPKIKYCLNNIYKELSSISYKELTFNVDNIKNTKFVTKSNTYYNAMGFNFSSIGCAYRGKIKVISTILNINYLHNEIRVKGGAYGANTEVSPEGYFIFYSYKDPNVDKTIEIFKSASNFLKNFNTNNEEMKKYIIATINLQDKPLHCYKVGERDIHRYMCGAAYQDLVQERKDILNTKLEDVKDFGRVMESCNKLYFISTVGNIELINKDNDLNVSNKLY